MGKLPWATIRKNVPQGGVVACRVATDYLIVAGVSNWGAYALSRAGDGASPSRSFEEKFHVAVFLGFGVFPFGNFFVELLASGLSG